MKELTVNHVFDLTTNMNEVKASIAETIAQYDIVIQEDQISEAKELMATFNKEKKDFSQTCKKFVDTISAPITEFKAQQKEIEAMFDTGRSRIANQVEKFEATKLKEIENIVIMYRDIVCDEKEIGKSAVVVNDLIMLSAVSTSSKGMTLTKKTKEAIDLRAQMVENERLKARLEAEEKAKRDREIADKARLEAEEKARQREAELIAKAERDKAEAIIKAEREKAEAVERAKQDEIKKLQDAEYRKSCEERKQVIEEAPPHQPHITEDGRRVFVVMARFDVLAPSNTEPDKIKSALEKKLTEAGITTLKSIEVH